MRSVVCGDVIEKVWGKEIVNENNELFCSKQLALNKGAFCSLHCHKTKMENFALVRGHVRLEVDAEIIDMRPGVAKTIFPGQYHRFAGYMDSLIFEASTYHSEEDVFRKEESFLAPLLLGVDVDGTLVNAGGVVGAEHLRKHNFVIVSSRSRQDSIAICRELGIVPLTVINSRILSKTEELRYVDRLYPLRRTIYIGDQESDRSSAERAGWQFMNPAEFIKLEL